MKTLIHRPVLFLAMALVSATLAGCGDVHPTSAAGTLVAQTEAGAPQSAIAQPQSATNIPF